MPVIWSNICDRNIWAGNYNYDNNNKSLFIKFEKAAFLVEFLQGNYFEKNVDKNYSDDVTIITSPIYSWIYKYAFNKDHITSHIRDSEPIRTAKVILVMDGVYQSFLSKESQEDKLQYERIRDDLQ